MKVQKHRGFLVTLCLCGLFLAFGDGAFPFAAQKQARKPSPVPPKKSPAQHTVPKQAGSVDVKHWAYIKPVRKDPPQAQNASWVRNPIDSFILGRLEKEGLAPSPEAERETLIRRVSLDLVGLPPTPEEVDAFVGDAGSDAYEKLVDRLLSSPRYGERWARPWLDLARYADTHGYEKDDRRSVWPYRDWVINALNHDMPFDQFTVEQIAGDMLPNPTVDQKTATGFHRNTMINEEGGVDPEEFRIAAIIDRVDTTATVWLGSTLACAQCHDHKFDPFTQEEYYRFFAFFNNTEEEVEVRGFERNSRGPKIEVPVLRPLAAHRNQVESQIVYLESLLGARTPQMEAAQKEWEQKMQPAVSAPWTLLDPTLIASAAGARLTKLEDKSVLASGLNPERDTYVVIAQTDLTGMSGVRLEALTHPSLPREGPGRSPSASFMLTRFELEISPLTRPDERQPVILSDAAADDSKYGTEAKEALDEDPSTGWAIAGNRESMRVDHQAVFVAEKPFGFEEGTLLTLRLTHESAPPQQIIGRFRLWLTTGKDPDKSVKVPVRIQSALATPAAERTEAQQELLTQYYRSIAPALAPLRQRLAALRKFWGELMSPTTLVMKELAEPRKTYVHLAGSFLSKGAQVTPGVPAALHTWPKDAPGNRLGLARWLVDAENPLVARVAVNRLWMHYFGQGIVETVEDFGSQGHAPTHPDLLDWLATEFMRLKWSMKALHRLIVTSATYRQSARVTPQLLERDPRNRLLARGPRVRLEAEMLRDTALAIAGLLSPRMGGPSVFPPQPDHIWNLVYNDDTWQNSEGEDRYRRGLYTFWRRTAPYPAFTTFDGPSREAICTRRIQTNTPLQSLTTLNDPAFFDAARGLARRILLGAAADTRQGVRYGFRLCTSRWPEAREVDRLVALFDQELENFRRDAAAAREISLGGDINPPQDVDLAQFAAWTVVANVLLNLDETLTKG